jgi:tetratricopeptide (TPR) repeat protein
VISAATIVLKTIGYDSDLTRLPGAFSWERLLVILKVSWLNLRTVVWPTGLTLHYEWTTPESVWEPQVWLGGIAVTLTGVLLWKLRRRRGILFGAAWFGVALAPTLHVIPHHIFRADRYLYLPLVGLAIAAAMILRPLVPALAGSRTKVAAAAAGILYLSVLGAVSFVQLGTWRSSLAAWEHCLRVQPDSAKAHDAFADNLLKNRRLDCAIRHYRKALELDPRNRDAFVNLVLQLTAGSEDVRDYGLGIGLAERYCELTHWKDAELCGTLAIAANNVAVELAGGGDAGHAIHYYNLALKADPDYQAPLFNLALLLAACPDRRWRDAAKAVQLAERACALAERRDPNGLMILAAAYAEAGRAGKAVATNEEAVELAEAAGNEELADQLRRQLERYHRQLGTPSVP